MNTSLVSRGVATLVGVAIGLWVASLHAENGRLAQSVANDRFANATTLAGAKFSLTGSNVGASREVGEPRHERDEGGQSVWWSWTAPFSGTAVVSTRGSDFNTLLGVYVGGSIDSLLPVTGEDTFDGLVFEAVSGTIYRIAVDGWGGASGNISLSLSLYSPPANDQFADAAVMVGATNTVAASNAGATREFGEPYHAQANTSHSVWWTWTAPFTGGTELVITGNFIIVFAVYIGDSLDRLTEVTNSIFGSRLIFEATAGTTYRIAVDGRLVNEMGDFTLTLRLSPPPANDRFANAFDLTGANVTVTGSNVAATREPGEPSPGGLPGGHSVWWNWTAPLTGSAEISTDGSDFYNLLGVYRGASATNLALVAEDARNYNSGSRVIFRAVQGNTYRIAVDGWNGAIGIIRLRVAVMASPPNDQFADAQVITGVSNRVNGSNAGASRELGEPNHNGNPLGRSVWWSWTPPFAGEVELSTLGSGFSTSVAIYSGDTVDNLTRVAGETFAGTIRFHVAGGRAYRIAIEGWNGDAGNITLSLKLSSPPGNDRWADAIAVTGSSLVIEGSNNAASKEPGEPNHAGYVGGHSVWWKWTAPWTGGVELSVTSSALSPVLAVYTGSSIDHLANVASSSFWFEPAIFRAEGGETYYFAADSRDGFSGAFELRLMLHPPVANDQFVDAIIIDGTSNTVYGSNVGATREVGEPNHDFGAGGHTVWWKWTASSAGSAEASTAGSDFSAVFSVYTGNAVNSLTAVASSRDFQPTRFVVVAGTTYWLAVDGRNRQTGNITLKVTSFPPPSNDPFASAIDLSASLSVTGSNLGATREPGEPNHGGFLKGHSVWWTWTASWTGEAKLEIDSGDFELLLAVYTGESLVRLTNVGNAEYFGVFPVTAGTTYRLAVDGRNGGAGDFSFHFIPIPSPANDQFAQATSLQGDNLTVQASNRGASLEPGEPQHGEFEGGHSIWWTWTAPSTGGAEILSLSQGNFFFIPVLAVYTGSSLDQLTPVGTSLGYSGPIVFRAVGGTTYRIAVDGLNRESGDVTLTVRLYPPVANDQFLDAIDIPGPVYRATGSNIGASKEAGEPDHAGFPGGRSVWWTWTAPGTGAAELRTDGGAFMPVVAVYTGTSLDRLTEVGRVERFDRGAVFDVQGGVKYYIAADGEAAGNIVISLTFLPPPANDQFASAIPITGPIRTVVGSNVGASREAGEPDHSVQAGGHSVWWSWTAPAVGGVEVKVSGIDFSPLLAVYIGNSVTNLQPVAHAQFSELAIFRAVTGTKYHFAVDGWNGQVGTVELMVRQFPPVTNDQFADAIALTEANHIVHASNVGATKEAGEPEHNYDRGGHSVWWNWTAPFTGGVKLSSQGSDFGILVDVYTGDSVDRLLRVPRFQSFDPIVFDAIGGTTYHIAADGRSGQAGNIVLRVNLSSPPLNDQFNDAIAIFGATNRLDGSNTSATREPGEPEHLEEPGGHSVWWRWTAPFTGEAYLSRESGTEFFPLLGVYTGSAVDRLTEVRLLPGERFHAMEGATYYISVDGPNGLFGEIHLGLTLLDPPANDSFSRATLLTGSSNTVSGSIAGASKEPGEPRHNGDSGGHSVWWTWTAPFNGTLQVDQVQAGFPVLFDVYTGDSVDDLTRVPPLGNFPRRLFPVFSGTIYRIVLDGERGFAGDYSLRLVLLPSPGNDQFAEAAPLVGAIASVQASNTGASREPGEPNHTGFAAEQSVWWSWLAPFTGAVEIRAQATTFTPVLAVYTGSRVDQLTDISPFIPGFSRPVIFRATAGTTYSIAVDGWAGQSGEFTLTLSLGVSFATNDRFVDAIPLAGPTNIVHGSNLGATPEPAEPNHAFYPAARSVWWTWTAPFSGGVEISTANSSFDTILAVYTGSSLKDLLLIGQNNNSGTNVTSQVRFDATAGTTYHIAVDGWNDGQGDITLRLTLLPPPANDLFADATAISGSAYQGSASSVGAGKELGEPDHEGESGGHSLWWTWTAPMTGGVEVDTAGTDFDTLLGVYTGHSVDRLSKVASTYFAGRLGFRAVADTKYYIAVDGAYGEFGNVALGLVLFPAVTNDQFAEATVLSGTNVIAKASNIGATREPGEPDHAFGSGGHSVWWKWTAPFNGGVTLSVQTPSFEKAIGIYTGDSVTNLTSVWDSSSFGLNQFAAEAGKTYYIAIDGWNGGTGEIELSLNLRPPPPNDLFADRIPLSGTNQTFGGSLLSASKEPGEPDHAGGSGVHSIWWSWTAPFTGGAELRFPPGGYGFQIGVYTGLAVQGLTEVARSDESGFVSFRAVEGTAYQIAVDSFEEVSRDFMLELRLFPVVENDQFVNALNLSGETILAQGSNVGATKEPGEPDHDFTGAAHSIWWNWTAPFSGGAELIVEQSDFEIRFGIYSGSAVDNLADVTKTGWFGSTRFRAVGGTTYRIAVDGWNRETGNVSFRLRLLPPPANDQFRNAMPVLGTIGTIRGTTFGASKEPGEPNHAGEPGGQSVWWRWTAPYTGGVEFLDPWDYQTLIGVYTGNSPDALKFVAQPRPGGPLVFRAVEGTTYYFAVDSREASVDILLHFRLLPPVSNDQFADAIPITGASTRVFGSNVGATGELGEPSHARIAPTRSVWWKWTAPFSGRADLTADESDFNAVLGVYKGSSLTSLTEVASAQASQPMAFRAHAGDTYYFAVDVYYGSPGQIVLRIALGPCTDPTSVSSVQDSGPGSLRQAIADACPDGIIEFHPSLLGQSIIVTNGPLIIEKNLTIAGPGAGQLAVSAQSRSSVFAIVRGAITISGLTIQNGSNQFGGGIINYDRLTLARCLVTANRASSSGGGIYNDYFGNLTIFDSTLSSNSSAFGGAVYNSGQAVMSGTTIGPANLAFSGAGYHGNGDLAMTNSTVAGNVAQQLGGGLVGERRGGPFNPFPSRTVLASCTVAGNTARQNGGGYAQLSQANLELWNTLIAGNDAVSSPDLDRLDPVLSHGHNLIGIVGLSSGWTNTDLIGTASAPVDPLLGPLQDNGGLTFTLALAANSLAVNRGDPNFVGPPFTDQRGPGFPRVVGRMDIGAWEKQNGAPLIACSPALLVECAAPNGTLALLTLTIQDPDGDELRVIWTVNGNIVRTNLLAAGVSAQPSIIEYAAPFSLGDSIVVAAVSDGIHESAFCTNTVTIQDTVPPSLQLVGANPITNLNLTPFVDPGARASDECEGDLSSRIVVRGPSDLTVPGQYVLVYSVADAAGNITTATRRVIILGLRDFQRTILAELDALRATVTGHNVLNKLGDARDHLIRALSPEFWADPTHLQRKHGEKAFDESRKAVDRLLELLNDKKNPIPAGVLKDLADRIARLMRSLAASAIQEGLPAGGEQTRIENAREELARGDSQLAKGEPDKAIDSYKRAWKSAVGAKITSIARLANGAVRLEIGGFPGQTYTIQSSADLIHWESVSVLTADQAGLIEFQDSLPKKSRIRFYRLTSLPPAQTAHPSP